MSQIQSFEALRFFLETVPTDTPHDLFRTQAKRASQTKQRFSLAEVAIIERKNAAVEMARFVIPTVSRNTKRHETIQDFMLVNDSSRSRSRRRSTSPRPTRDDPHPRL
jgi:hypothetical protein